LFSSGSHVDNIVVLKRIIALLACLAANRGLIASSPEWVMLTDCQYVAGADNDGDSFRVHCGANEFVLRLYFVDTPETNLRYPERTREQSEYFGVTLDETMKAGRTARDLVRDTLQKPFTVWTRWASGGGRAKEPRYYGFVMLGSMGLDEFLISKGLAQPKGVRPNLPTGEKAAAHLEKLHSLEATAQKQKNGLWVGWIDKKPETVVP
jgi:endonuclease YncB( thermonuclease family)